MWEAGWLAGLVQTVFFCPAWPHVSRPIWGFIYLFTADCMPDSRRMICIWIYELHRFAMHGVASHYPTMLASKGVIPQTRTPYSPIRYIIPMFTTRRHLLMCTQCITAQRSTAKRSTAAQHSVLHAAPHTQRTELRVAAGG